ncbi:unnamed protein product [Cyprideis torosa]|uniref:E3 ubiquitin-protein ligase n=1 Tax=Cyprideis torosa TaxID=163714 RepID=A0A7R8W5Q0_9CRUS|nr:unnamed protein product [Cyprideis torosa]CAG0885549.1 unnamed protein product [Cyprideis torosa]
MSPFSMPTGSPNSSAPPTPNKTTTKQGDQTLDVSVFFPAFSYILNFCNMTQVKKTNGAVRSIQRAQQPSYPLVKVAQSEPLATDHLSVLFETARLNAEAQVHATKGSKKGHHGDRSSGSDSSPTHHEGGSSTARALFRRIARIGSKDEDRKSLPPSSTSGGVPGSSAIAGSSRHSTFLSPVTAPPPPPSLVSSHSSAPTESSSSYYPLHRRPSLDTISTYLSQDSSRSLKPPPLPPKKKHMSGGNCGTNEGASKSSAALLPSLPVVPPLSPVSTSSSSFILKLKDLRTSSKKKSSPPAPKMTTSQSRSCPSSPVPRMEDSPALLSHLSPLDPSLFAQPCVVCIASTTLRRNSSYNKTTPPTVAFRRCGHGLHYDCAKIIWYQGAESYLQCPACQTIHGTKRCFQPPDGRMSQTIIRQPLPGYTCDTIQITYEFPHRGIQPPGFPNAGLPYAGRGFPKVTYLPDNPLGRKVFDLFVTAWNRRVLFELEASQIPGDPTDVVVFNKEIEHKTELWNINGLGYPDPGYLKRVIDQLKAQGVEIDGLDMEGNPLDD